MDRFLQLVNAGVAAVDKVNADCGTNIQTELHFAFNVVEGSNKTPIPTDEQLPRVNELFKRLSASLAENGNSVDRIGISYYPDWHGSWTHLEENIAVIRGYMPDVRINVSECSPPMQSARNDANRGSYTATVQTQGDDIGKLMQIVSDIPNNLGIGVLTWGGSGSYQYGPVNFTTSGNPRQPYASIKVYKDAFPANAVESGIYVTTKAGAAPALPATVRNIDAATGVITDVPVSWGTVNASSFAAPGTFTVAGTAATGGNMNAVTAQVSVVEELQLGPVPIIIDPVDIEVLNKTADGTKRALVEFDLSTTSGFDEEDLGKIKPAGFLSDTYQGSTAGSTWILKNRPDGTGRPAKLSAWAEAEFADAEVCCKGSSKVLASCPGKPVTITGITLGGTERENYTLAQTTATVRAHITERTTRTENNQYNYAPLMNLRQDFMMGIDLSSEPALRASTASPYSTNNFIFSNKAGEAEDIYKIYADHGVTYVRARVWNDPHYRGETIRTPSSGSLGVADQYQPMHPQYGDGYGPGTYGGGNNDIDKALEMGLRVTQYGMKLLLNFHYSDCWADPSRQYAPKAWRTMNITEKTQALYNYTYESLEKLVINGVDVGMVQVGNETQGQMAGESTAANFYRLVKSGCDAIDDINAKYGMNIKKSVHFTNQSSAAASIRTWVTGIQNLGADLDMVLLSWYPEYTSHGTIASLLNTLNSLVALYPGLEVGVGETDNRMRGTTFTNQATLFPDYNPNPQGQAKELYDVIAQVAKVDGNKGVAVFYWEPAWTTPIDAASRRYYGTGWASRYSSYYDANNTSASSDGNIGSSQGDKNTFTYTTANGGSRTPLPSMDVWSLVYGGGGRAPASPEIKPPDYILKLDPVPGNMPGTVRAELSNNTSGESFAGYIIIAVYDAGGRLVKVATKDVTIDPGEKVELLMPVSGEYTGYDVKAFAWNNQFVPIVADESMLMPAPIVITSIDAVTVSTLMGTAPVLPAAVTARYSNNTSVSTAVVWDDITPSQYADIGSCTVDGTVALTSIKAVATVSVYGIVSINPASVSTLVGAAPSLPPTVTVNYSNNTSGSAAVIWESILPSQYAAAGSFVVAGTVAGTSIKASCTVTVSAAVNMLVDPGFENNNRTAISWSFPNAGTWYSSAAFNTTATYVRTGTRSASVSNGGLGQRVNLTAGKTYRLTAWIYYTATGGDTFYIGFNDGAISYPGDSRVQAISHTRAAPVNTWKQLTVTFTPTITKDYVIYTWCATNAASYFDDFELLEI
jgi:arabinogalactan endo-1,4-beta-galactosidase